MLTGEDDAPVGDMAAPFSMASEEADDAPGKNVRSENLRIEDFDSPTEHALAVRDARDAEEGLIRPGHPRYEGLQALAASQDVSARLEEEAAARDREARADLANEIRKASEPEPSIGAKIFGQGNLDFLQAIPGAAADAYSTVGDAVMAANEAIQGFSLADTVGDVVSTVAEDPGAFVPAAAKAAAQAGAPFQAAMAQVDPARAGQLVQLGLG